MHVVAACDVAERFAPVAAANRLAPLVRGEFEGSPQALPSRLRPIPAFAGAGADQLALELGESAENGQHQTPVCRRVGPRVAERAEPDFLLLDDRPERVQQIAGRARQPVEQRRHCHHVTGSEAVEQPAKLCAAGLGPARTSRNTFSAPASVRAATCTDTVCPSVDPRA
jgi:hypothetical protein